MMDDTVSVAKGVFVYKNSNFKRSMGDTTKKKSAIRNLKEQLSYKTFTKIWFSIQQDISELQKEGYTKTIEEVVSYAANAHKENYDCILPIAALLTGINHPDHLEQFENIKSEIFKRLHASVAIIQSRDCGTLKYAIETMVRNFIEVVNKDETFNEIPKKIRKSQCTMQSLENWYVNQSSGKELLLVVIIPDFEGFNAEILEDFILILNSYCDRISFVLILGVATAVCAIHNTLSYRVISKVKLKIFQTNSVMNSFNKIFDEVVLSPKYSFNLSGKILKFLSDIFLFYDFSINGFINEFKYCLLEHFLQDNVFSLCINFQESLENLKYLTHDEFEVLRQLPSFRPFVESIKNPAKILSMFITSKYWLKKVVDLLKKCQIYFKIFRCFIVFLTSLVGDLPNSPLGKHKREVYIYCLSKDLIETESFRECWKILELFSKEEFVFKINKAIGDTTHFIARNLTNGEVDSECQELIFGKFDAIKTLLRCIEDADIENELSNVTEINRQETQFELGKLNRHQLKEKLLQMSKKAIPVSNFIRSIQQILEYIKIEIVFKHLSPPDVHGLTFYELFTFSDLTSIRRHVMGSPRGSLHTALNDPNFYLQCDCCELDLPQTIKNTLPDISIAYKLHLECGKLINLYDWLQAFRSITDYQEDDNDQQIDPKIQASFTRAVAELQFLGYIKTSKRKTDHVTRLTCTWKVL
ncbi:origin recognition complex subunit 3 [Condylostylus longicornis]|uniref:origin recognition complex subunit 3 n=1 Tax=Condylostylus longicornis TaxID=2530218 RepID=UPI00244E589F|nr:origin recognition complex subunit 3 [Condylostylus longicornis]